MAAYSSGSGTQWGGYLKRAVSCDKSRRTSAAGFHQRHMQGCDVDVHPEAGTHVWRIGCEGEEWHM
jgi:hypothetical protein